MTHEGFPSLISLDLSYHLHRDHTALRKWLAGSVVLHIVIACLAMTLRFTPTIEQPLSSYEVSLVTLPTPKEVTHPTSKPRTSSKKPRSVKKTEKPKSKPATKARKVQKKPVPPPPKPQKKPLPPLSTSLASERLSESLSSVAKSVAVPKKLTSQAPVEPPPSVKTSPSRPKALENIKLPSETPSLAPVQPLAPAEPLKAPETTPEKPPEPSLARTTPTPKATPPPKKLNVENALKEIKTPPKSPTLASVQPFTKAQATEASPSTHEPLSQSLREKIKSVQIPSPKLKSIPQTKKRSKSQTPITPPPVPTAPTVPAVPAAPAVPEAPKLAKAIPQKKAAPLPVKPRERLSDSLKQVLESVKVPQLRDVSKAEPVPPVPSEPPSPTRITPNPEPTTSPNFRSEIDQQLAKLKVPEVVPIESIRTRLQVKEAPSKGAEPGQSGSISKSSRKSEGHNRYLALVQAQIDQQWVAPPVEAHEKNLQVALNFRILRSGKVIDLDIERGSGNRYFDSAALRAVQGADPLPKFTPDISGSSLVVTITFKVEKDAP